MSYVSQDKLVEEGVLDPVTGEELAQRHAENQERIAGDFAAKRKQQFHLLQSRMSRKKEDRANRLRARQQRAKNEVGVILR